jgi:hypothetical protein
MQGLKTKNRCVLTPIFLENGVAGLKKRVKKYPRGGVNGPDFADKSSLKTEIATQMPKNDPSGRTSPHRAA